MAQVEAQRATNMDDTAAKRHPNDFPLGVDGFHYRDLYDPEWLQALHRAFEDYFEAADAEGLAQLQNLRATGAAGLSDAQRSAVLLRAAPHLSGFLAKLFDIEAERAAQQEEIRRDHENVFAFRASVVKRATTVYTADDLIGWDIPALTDHLAQLQRVLLGELAPKNDEELALAMAVMRIERIHGALLAETKARKLGKPVTGDADAPLPALRELLADDPTTAQLCAQALAQSDPLACVQALLEPVERWVVAALNDPSLRAATADWQSLRKPENIDYQRLVEWHVEERDGYSVLAGPEHTRRRRDGFALTDARATPREARYEVDQCVYCHERGNDNCSKGQINKEEGGFRKNPLGVTQIGCPLEEKISEALILKRQGDNIASLATMVIDNPMLPGTGHRICNECMKGCVFQKVREPVNIPQIETNVLTDVLFLPYGFEIYSLLTRWNPLNVKRPQMLPYNGKKVLVVGLGPAGYTLSHYLLNEGFGVVAVDALKLEPLPAALVGDGTQPPAAVRDFRDLYEDLGKRTVMGFGGVAEYGITVRWDKNFLKVIYLALARRHNFRAYGGVRLGSTLNIEDAWTLGFDHIALASGAGKPTVVGLKNNLARGVRKASDFLMALQLSGAAKKSSLANLQLRLPVGVIGGGLTATDAVTEALAYYPVQVEKMLDRYEALVAKLGVEHVWQRFDAEERVILEEFLSHGHAIRTERVRAAAAGEQPDFQPLLKSWGGVTLFYRKGLIDSPAYYQNHEEVIKAMEEGLTLAEGMSPIEAFTDDHGYLEAVQFDKLAKRDDGKWVNTGEQPIVPLRTLLVAAGTKPNTIYENENPGTFKLEGNFFQRFEPELNGAEGPKFVEHTGWGLPKEVKPAPFTSYENDGRRITYYGDNHPVYAGNVVKAMASAKDGYPYVVRLFADEIAKLDPAAQPARDAELCEFQQNLDGLLRASVVRVERLTPTIVEIVLRAPMAARKFQPGQFYRLQNYESLAPVAGNTTLATEGLALTGAWVDREEGLVGLIALEMGTSSRLCGTWQAGMPVILMGPTGAPTTIPKGETVALLGGGLGNAVLFSIGKALRDAGNRVLYFAGYRHPQDVFKVPEIEAAADVIVWSVDKHLGMHPIPTTRPQDRTFVGNIVESMIAYSKGELGSVELPLSEADRIIVIGSDRMMSAVKAARFAALAPYIKSDHVAIGSINSPMQCMMKGVCAQCMCKHVDPESGKESFVYTCYDQDQPLDRVDFIHLNARLRQNTTQEKLANLWLDHLFETHPLPRI